MKKGSTNTKILSDNNFPVIGVGASAGGLAAFTSLIKAIPPDSGMAFVLVQHLSPTKESLLPELLQKITSIPVLEISDDIKVMPNHIYILPSNKMLIANDGVLELSPRPENSSTNNNRPIDLFFTSLAQIHRSHAIGIVLSGLASDGTLGLKAIKDQGGITFAQDEMSAKYDEMPRNAARAGVVDYIYSPEEMPQKLLEIKTARSSLNGGTDMEEKIFSEILALLKIVQGTDFTYYKQNTIRRRITRRMLLNKNYIASDYLKYLQDNKKEQISLYQDLLIPVTSFFRDPKVFANLSENIFPKILEKKADGEPIRIWVASCSTGQEAFSMAICIKEYLGNNTSGVQVFATDLSEPAIVKARNAVYSKAEMEGVSDARVQKYFKETKEGYQLSKEIRQMCIFAVHNYLKDPPFGKMDFVSCRNALIYMEPYLQNRALTTFHYALNPTGYLLLGKSETNTSATELFTCVNKTDKLYTRKNVPGRFIHVASQRVEEQFQEFRDAGSSDPKNGGYLKMAEDIILTKYSPVGVIINEEMNIVHFRGNTSKYLIQTAGKPTHNLIKMAKNGLGFDLRSLVHKARKGKVSVEKEAILLENAANPTLISLVCIPLIGIEDPHYLILFNERVSSYAGIISSSKKNNKGKIEKDDRDLHIEFLEKEISILREDMRSVSEEQEVVNEDLQSSNEELLSGSEEMQSLNEELETSKEELQSSNEELTVLNTELNISNDDLQAARDYSDAIINTLPESLIILDRTLRIVRANGFFYKTFGFTEKETKGELIYDLGGREWNILLLRNLLEEILPEKKEVQRFEIIHSFRAGKKTMLINAKEVYRKSNDEKLILILIKDVTEQKKLQEAATNLLTRFQELVLQAPVAMCILRSPEYEVELANDSYLRLVNKDKDFLNKAFFDVLPELEEQGIRSLLDIVWKSGQPYFGNEVEIKFSQSDNKHKTFYNVVYQPMHEADKSMVGIIVIVSDVTELVMARKKMEIQAEMVRDLLMTAPGFVCILKGPLYVFDLINERFQQLFGRRSLIGKPMMEALPELKGQGFEKLLHDVYTKGIPYLGIDIPVTVSRDIGLEPEISFFNFSYQPMYDEEKNITSILVFGYEVTEQVIAKNKLLEVEKSHSAILEEIVGVRTQEILEINRSLIDKNDELVRMNAELESFAYISSHDLQEPLRKIQLFSKRLIDTEFQNLSEQGKELFNRMHKAAMRMRDLIEDLLTYSRTSIEERTFQRTDLGKMMDEVRLELADVILEKNATIISENLSEANINPFQFRQIMNNLVGNSLKFSKQDVPLILTIKSTVADGLTLETLNERLPKRKLTSYKNYCHISFVDNGIGFDQEYNEQIFSLFQRLHAKELYPGTGIGLAIVKKIIENHHGFITASGVSGEGARFDIYIPEVLAD